MEVSLAGLGENVNAVNQDVLERQITRQASRAMTKRDHELDQRRLERTRRDIGRVQARMGNVSRRMDSIGSSMAARDQARLDMHEEEESLAGLEKDLQEIQDRMAGRKLEHADIGVDEREEDDDDDRREKEGEEVEKKETEREYLLRTGKITPFSRMTGLERMHEVEEVEGEERVKQSHQDLRRPGLYSETYGEPVADIEEDDDEQMRTYATPNASAAEEEDVNDDELDAAVTSYNVNKKEDFSGVDDGDERVFRDRVLSWTEKREAARVKAVVVIKPEPREEEEGDEEEEWHKPHPTEADATYDGGYRVPGDIYPNLFDYQKTCVQWLWELHCQGAGGIIGDEMGLGKTIQVISFLAGLHYSRMPSEPTIVVCPATLMKQWVNEFHSWWPPFRVTVLHSSGSGMMDVRSEESLERDIEHQRNFKGRSKSYQQAAKVVDRVCRQGHVLITTYAGLRIYSDLLLPVKWSYCILDEGHKIRNPDSVISIVCKQVKTVHRLILSGTPMQNNLTELWSLFDFVFPGRLGTLPVFQTEFAIPINIGGYANATNVQVQAAYKCALVLRDLINPYLLRRMKMDVATDLPQKSEQVLFCKLTNVQRQAYEAFISSEEMTSIINGKRQVLYGVDILRKICNHPDLVDRALLLVVITFFFESAYLI